MSEPSTPLMRQYAAIKKDHPTALLFFRLGDFYELFFEDAQVAARELQITLTSRNKEKGTAIPMCGVPYHSAEGYIAKLIRKGFKVAICEQMEDPRIAKKLVKREVTRVVTPGTAADSQLGAEENNFLACVASAKDVIGFAALDLSTGEFRATEFRGSDADRRIREELLVLRPREVLFASSMPLFDLPRQQSAVPVRSSRAETGQPGECHLGRDTARRLGVRARTMRFRWSKTTSAFFRWKASDWRTDRRRPQPPEPYSTTSGLLSAGRSITSIASATTNGRIAWCSMPSPSATSNFSSRYFPEAATTITLFRSLDRTVTPMGKRLLRAWMLRPSIDRTQIERRLDAVEVMVKDLVAREELRRSMEGILDLERLLSRVTLETANPRDMLTLAASFAKLRAVRATLSGFSSARLQELHAQCDELADLRDRIASTLEDEPPITLNDGGVIRAGVDSALGRTAQPQP